MRRLLALVTLALVIGAAVAGTVSAQSADQAVQNGWFFSQTGPGDGDGFSVTDADGIPFWTEFQAAGGVGSLGYPVSRRWTEGALTYQAFQKTVFQWQPGRGLFRVNIYDNLSRAGLDDELLVRRNVPKPWNFPKDAGQPFSFVQQNHLTLLELNEAIKEAWYSNPRWLSDYGLPVAYEDFGNLRVLRAQRTVFQQWMFQTSFARPGQVVLSNGGDHYKDAGLVPKAATLPHGADEVVATVTPAPTPVPTPAPPPAPTPVPPPTSAPIGEVLRLAASPVVFQDQTIWLGTSTGGVLRSTSAGAGFTQVISGLPNLTINAIAPSPTLANDGIVLVATNNGIGRSSDRGQTWTAGAGLPASRISGIVASPRFESDRTFYALAEAGSLYQSTDGGANWSGVSVQHANGLPAGSSYLGLTAVNGRGENIHIFAWTSLDLLVSDNRGRGFKSVIGKKALPKNFRISAVAIHPEWNYDDVIWLGSEANGIYRSENGGGSFHRVLKNSDDVLGRINVIALSPNVTRDGTIVAGTEKSGFFISKRNTQLGTVKNIGAASSWNHQSTNLKISNVRGLAFSNGYSGDQTIYATGGTHFAVTGNGANDWFLYPDSVGPTG